TFAKSAVLATAASYSKVMGANERVRMGYIGLGNRGDQVEDAFLEHGDNETVAVCDLRDDYMDFAIKKSRAHPKKYENYRALLDAKDVDAVAIATPDHWHALDVHRCLQRRQRCVRGKAAMPDGRRRPQDGAGGRADEARIASGHAAPLDGRLQGSRRNRALR